MCGYEILLADMQRGEAGARAMDDMKAMRRKFFPASTLRIQRGGHAPQPPVRLP